MGRKIGGLGLVNFKDHPSDNRYKIFNFNSIEEAEYFEKLLNEKSLWFEKNEEHLDSLATIHFSLNPEKDRSGTMYLYATRQLDFDKVQNANFLVNAKFRGFIIKNPVFRYGLVILFLCLLAFAIYGYIKVN